MFGGRRSTIIGLLALVWALAGCAGPVSTLDPRGPRAAEEARLWWIMFGLGMAVYAIVLGLLFVAVFRSRRAGTAEPGGVASGGGAPGAGESRERVNSSLLIIAGGIVGPLIILPVIWVLTLRSMAVLASPATPTQLTVEVTGRQWSYEVRYPAQRVTLLNEMRIPTGTPVQLKVGSSDVIHSFWVPRLMGKIDMIPGRSNERWIEASQPDTYLVECAEFCGLWHARMRMAIIAMTPDDFAAWLASQPAGP